MATHEQVSDALGSVAETVVRVPSLTAPLRVMHITDSHIDLGPDEQSGSLDLCHYLHGRYKDGFKFNEQRGPDTVHGHQPLPPCDVFEAQVAEAKRRGADLVLHTGDLLNFPSPKAAEWAVGTFHRHDLRFLCVSGNHDWQHCNPNHPHTLEGPEMGSDGLRTEWRERALPALFEGRNPSHWCEDIGGLRFIGIDNSTRYITPTQLDFFAAAAATAAGVGGAVAPPPVVLLMHIPLRVETLMDEGRPDGGGATGTARLAEVHVLDGQPNAEEEAQWRDIAPPGALEATRTFITAGTSLNPPPHTIVSSNRGSHTATGVHSCSDCVVKLQCQDYQTCWRY